jgi:hypothetical protein
MTPPSTPSPSSSSGSFGSGGFISSWTSFGCTMAIGFGFIRGLSVCGFGGVFRRGAAGGGGGGGGAAGFTNFTSTSGPLATSAAIFVETTMMAAMSSAWSVDDATTHTPRFAARFPPSRFVTSSNTGASSPD